MKKEWWKSKTIWANTMALLVAGLGVSGFIDQETAFYAAGVLCPALNVGLRAITKHQLTGAPPNGRQ